MAFTKINAAGIGTTETVTVDGLTVINDGSFGGNLTVSGVLTYEDVTNVDSVGLITARNGIVVGSGITLSNDGDIFATGITTVSGNVKVGTGITLSPDGDVFFTGVGTGNGSGLTALNASNLASGTVPTARLGSGTASSSTFLRGDSTFQTVNTDLVSDTTPQLGGNLDVNTKNILFGDSSDGSSDDVLKFGAGSDLSLFHNGTDSRIVNTTGDLSIRGNSLKLASTTGEEYIRCTADSSVILFHDNVAKFTTNSDGYRVDDNVKAQFGTGTDLEIYHNGTVNLIQGKNSANIYIQGDDVALLNQAGNQTSIWCNSGAAVQLYYANALKIETESNGASVTGRLRVKDSGDVDLVISDTSTNAVSAFIGVKTAGRVEYNCYKSGVGTKYPHVFVGYTEEYARIDTNGIKFNGDTAVANALDDYEEGTFDALICGTSNPNTYYVTGTGKYTKIGNVVDVHMSWDNMDMDNTASGNIMIRNLPFTSSTHQYTVTTDHYLYNVGFNTGRIQSWYVNYSATTMQGIESKPDLDWDGWSVGNFTASGTYLRVHVTYLSAKTNCHLIQTCYNISNRK